MELDESYNLNFLHVEESIAQNYRDGINKLRNSDNPSDSRVYNYFDRPKTTTLRFNKSGAIQIRKVIIPDQFYFDSSRRSIKDEPDQEVQDGDSILLEKNVFDDRDRGTNVWYVTVNDGNRSYELFLPSAAFTMSKIAGNEDSELEIEFTGHENTNLDYTQMMRMVTDDNKEEVIKSNGSPLFASMRIPSTNISFLWFLENSENIPVG